MDDGRPPPRCGNFFVSVHGGRSRPGPANSRNLDELFGFSVTLTMRVTVPLDRVGDQQISRNLALELARKQGFNAKVEQLRTYLHMNWRMTVMHGEVGRTSNSANDNIAAWGSGTVYGFAEPARYLGETLPKMVGGEWFASEPDSEDVGVTVELRFEGARRFQPHSAVVGTFT